MNYENISERVEALHQKASEANQKGDFHGFFNYSQEALDLVNDWIRKQKSKNDFLVNSFKKDIKIAKTGTDVQIAFDWLNLAIKKVELGLPERKFDLVELNKHLMIKAI